MLLTKKEIFERLKQEGIDLGKNPFRTFSYYQETGLIPEPEGKKKNSYLFPERTVDAVKRVYNLQKDGESIPEIKKRYEDFSLEHMERQKKKREEIIILIDNALKKEVFNAIDLIPYMENHNLLPNIDGINIKELLKKYGDFVAYSAILKLIVNCDFLNDADIKDGLLKRKTA